MMPHDMLVLLRWSPEAFSAVIAAVGIFFRVDGNDVPLESRSVGRAVITVLALVHPPASVDLDVLLQVVPLPETPFTALARERLVFGVHRQDVAAEDERIGDLKVAVPALVHLLVPV